MVYVQYINGHGSHEQNNPSCLLNSMLYVFVYALFVCLCHLCFDKNLHVGLSPSLLFLVYSSLPLLTHVIFIKHQHKDSTEQTQFHPCQTNHYFPYSTRTCSKGTSETFTLLEKTCVVDWKFEIWDISTMG